MNRQKIADIIDRRSHTDRIDTAYVYETLQGVLVHRAGFCARVHHRLPAEVGHGRYKKQQSQDGILNLSVFFYGNHRPAVYLTCHHSA